MNERHGKGFHGPACWALTLLAGLALGFVLTKVLPAPEALAKGPPNVGPMLSIPFAALLLSIALMPFINAHFWEHHFPDFAFFLGGIMISYYIFGLSGFKTLDGHEGYGLHRMEHVGLEYFQFIALVGSLYIVTGGVHIQIKGSSSPWLNVAILATGAVIANVIGTTGAAALLIRAYLKVNQERIKAFHVILFIFIVANCGGCLTPIGDPPLFLGYLQGIPFNWTVEHCVEAWAMANVLLLIIFFVMDTRAIKAWKKEREEAGEPVAPHEKNQIQISGWLNFFWLGVVLFGVFFDKIFHTHCIGAFLQIAAAIAAYKLAKPENLQANGFSFGPIKEVGLIFVGLFATMVPALDYLGNNAASLGVSSPSAFFWSAGALSSVLDNAPTYLNFLQAAHGLEGISSMGPEVTPGWLAVQNVGGTGFPAKDMLLAISLGSVFFGANTYIGNAPNFMVKAIAETSGVKMPSFFGYIIRFSLPILICFVLPLIWLFFFVFKLGN